MSDPIVREYLEHMGYRGSLQKLVWGGYSDPDTASLKSLESNPQLTAFGVNDTLPTPRLDRMLPVLRTFPNLKVLSLVWDENMIAHSSITALSALVGLQQLHINCSNEMGGWRRTWVINHEAIQSDLSTLRDLKKLIITQDSYRINNGVHAQKYYESRMLDAEDMQRLAPQLQGGTMSAAERLTMDSFLKDSLWETSHCRRMTSYAEKYALTFPRLEFIHLGQLSFSIASDGPTSYNKYLYILLLLAIQNNNAALFKLILESGPDREDGSSNSCIPIVIAARNS
ncbi:hypothetical protein BJX99DRAFT_264590 [Aspergillus californicus]